MFHTVPEIKQCVSLHSAAELGSLLRKPLIHRTLKNEEEPPIYTDKAFNYRKMYSCDFLLQS